MISKIKCLTVLLSVSPALAASISTDTHIPGVVSFDLLKKREPKYHMEKRSDGDIGVSLKNEFVWYGIKLDIGTPSQELELQIDTGSSDMWVASAFDSSKSSTFHLNETDYFSVTYGDGTSASGNFAQDTVGISGTDIVLQQANFAYAPNTMSSPQVCGIGMIENESSTNRYLNFPAQLKAQGKIATEAYSIFIGSDHQDGNIIFGGVDSSRYTGKLQKIPLVSSSQFMVSMDSIHLNGSPILDSPLDVLLDTGTTVMLLPESLVNSMIKAIDPNSLQYVVDCAKINTDDYFEFSFSGATINVPFRNLVDARSYNFDGSFPTSGQCNVGFQSTSSNTFILGDKFLMGAYVVFDLENKEVSIANSGSSSGQIQAISGPGQIPGAVDAPLYHGSGSSSTPDSSSSTSASSSASSSSSSTSSSTPDSSSSSSTSSSTSSSSSSTSSSTPDSSSSTSSTPDSSSSSSSSSSASSSSSSTSSSDLSGRSSSATTSSSASTTANNNTDDPSSSPSTTTLSQSSSSQTTATTTSSSSTSGSSDLQSSTFNSSTSVSSLNLDQSSDFSTFRSGGSSSSIQSSSASSITSDSTATSSVILNATRSTSEDEGESHKSTSVFTKSVIVVANDTSIPSTLQSTLFSTTTVSQSSGGVGGAGGSISANATIGVVNATSQTNSNTSNVDILTATKTITAYQTEVPPPNSETYTSTIVQYVYPVGKRAAAVNSGSTLLVPSTFAFLFFLFALCI